MVVKKIENKNQWDLFFNDQGSPSFLHSWEWGEFQQNTGHEVIRVGLFNKEGGVLAIAQIIKIKAKRGNFLFIPHGPIIKKELSKENTLSILEAIKKYLTLIAKKEGYSFIRISPVMEDNQINKELFRKLGFIKAPIYMHAERMWILPLEKKDDEILAEMRKTTRYLIRKAVKEGVVVEKKNEDANVDLFWSIYEKTAKREKFVPFSKKFITEEYRSFKKNGNALFLMGYANGRCLASALIIFTKSAAFYHQGASIHTKIPVTYLLQWEAIKEAQKRGCKIYNFWGILQEGRTPKAWSGLTLFKQGFGGKQIDYLATQDLILSPKYYLSLILEKILSLKRGV